MMRTTVIQDQPDCKTDVRWKIGDRLFHIEQTYNSGVLSQNITLTLSEVNKLNELTREFLRERKKPV